MKKTVLSLMIAGAIAFGVASTATASDPAVFKVPFSFVVGEKLLPPGTYRITTGGEDRSLLLIVNTSGKGGAVAAVSERVSNPAPDSDDAHVAFKSYAGQRFLWQVATPGSDAYRLTLRERQMDRALARLNLLPAERGDVASK